MQVFCIDTSVIGNNLKTKTKTAGIKFPNFPGIYVSKYHCVFLIIIDPTIKSKHSITKFIKTETNINRND